MRFEGFQGSLDYADQRYYASAYGRFNTPDPYVAGGAAKGSVNNPSDPGSWNRYAYALGDPINRNDRHGTDSCVVVSQGWDSNGNILFYDDCQFDDYWDYSPANVSGAMFCWFDPACHANAQQAQAGGGDAALSQFMTNAMSKACDGLPDGVVMAASVGAAAGIGFGFGGEVVFNMNTGQVSVFGQYNFTASGISSPSASAQAGFIWGLGQSNSSYSGPFTSINLGAGIIAAAAATTSQGWTNPFNFSNPTSVTGGVQTPGAGFSYGISQYSNPIDIGNLNNSLFDAAFSALNNSIYTAVTTYYSLYQGLCGSH